MNRLKGRMLAGVLAAVTLFSSVPPGTAHAAEPAEADTSVEAFSSAEESEPEGTEELEESETPEEDSGEAAAGATAAEENEEEDTSGRDLADEPDDGQTDENASEAEDPEADSTWARQLYRPKKMERRPVTRKKRPKQEGLQCALILKAAS